MRVEAFRRQSKHRKYSSYIKFKIKLVQTNVLVADSWLGNTTVLSLIYTIEICVNTISLCINNMHLVKMYLVLPFYYTSITLCVKVNLTTVLDNLLYFTFNSKIN